MKAWWMCSLLAALVLVGCTEGDDSDDDIAGPQILVSVPLLALGTTQAGTPGTVATYDVSAGRLAGNLNIAAPAGVEIRTTGGVFGAGLSLAPDSTGTVAPTAIEARISAAATVGQAFAVIGHTATGVSLNLALTGSVTAVPGIQVSVPSLPLGTTTVGTAGTPVSYDVSATAIAGTLTITAPTGTEVRLAGGTFAATAVIAPDSMGNVATTGMELRVSAGASVGAGSGNVAHTDGTVSQNLAVTWNVIPAPVDQWSLPAGLQPTPQLIDPFKRYGHGLVWLGSGASGRMVFWGGITISSTDPAVNTARVYNPATDQFEDTTTFAPNLQDGNGAPGARHGMACVAVGDKLFIWGGSNGVNQTTLDDGGVYDFSSDTWFSGTGASEHENFRTSGATGAPAQRAYASAVWTGPTSNKILIWGGYEISFSNPGDKNDGYIYDIATDTWSAMSTTGAPSPRNNAIAGFSGGKLFVYSGTDVNGQVQVDGGVYDLATDTWVSGTGAANFERLRTGTGAPANAPRSTAAFAMINGLLFAWAGSSSGTGLNDGWVYDPGTDTFLTRANLNAGTGAPQARYATAGCTDGTKFYVFGGTEPNTGPGIFNNGGVYEP